METVIYLLLFAFNFVVAYLAVSAVTVVIAMLSGLVDFRGLSGGGSSPNGAASA